VAFYSVLPCRRTPNGARRPPFARSGPCLLDGALVARDDGSLHRQRTHPALGAGYRPRCHLDRWSPMPIRGRDHGSSRRQFFQRMPLGCCDSLRRILPRLTNLNVAGLFLSFLTQRAIRPGIRWAQSRRPCLNTALHSTFDRRNAPKRSPAENGRDSTLHEPQLSTQAPGRN